MDKRQAVLDFVERCRILSGDGAGEPFKVLPFQRKFIWHAFAGEGNAALSMARGGGKTALCSAIAAAHMVPPLRQPGADIVIVASSFDQGLIDHTDSVGYLRSAGWDVDDRKVWRNQSTANRAILEHRPTSARLVCKGANAKTLHGLRPLLVLCDEPTQWLDTQRAAIFAALDTGLGKMPHSRLIALGTAPRDEDHWFRRMLTGHNVRYAQWHKAGADDDPFALKTWKKANPSWPALPSLRKKIREEAKRAALDTAELAKFKSLRLNLGVDDVESAWLMDAENWKRIIGDAPRAGPMVMAFDLALSYAMCACAVFWPHTGRLEAVACFPSVPSLHKRGQLDGVEGLYERMAERDELQLIGKRAASVAGFLKLCLLRYGMPATVVADYYKHEELLDALEEADFLMTDFVTRRMGPFDGAADCTMFIRGCLEDKVVPLENLMLSHAVSSARLKNTNGNWHLAKSSEAGRSWRMKDDGAAASILAVAVGLRQFPAPDDDDDDDDEDVFLL